MENGYLLVSDVDGTLLGDDDSLGKFAAWIQSRRDWLTLVYNSGRFCHSVFRSVASTLLPQPDAVIGGVGTEIYCCRTGRQIGCWPEPGIDWQRGRIVSLLSQFADLELQPAEYLSQFKISYFIENATGERLAQIRDGLSQAGCHVDLVYSSNRDLDVLPLGINKGSATAFLASHWSYTRDRVFVSGDTNNDLAMFSEGFRGIVVANALDELKYLNPSQVYQAKSAHAKGVLEGLNYWLSSPIAS